MNRKGRQQAPFGALGTTTAFGGGAFGQPAVSQNLFQRMLFSLVKYRISADSSAQYY